MSSYTGGEKDVPKYKFSWLDWMHYGFFASHIPITMFLDLQGLFPRSIFPSFAKSLFDYHVREFNDPLMGSMPKPAWFRSFMGCEALFQLPFFGVALYAMHNRGSWIRIPGIIYGAHTATTVIAVLADILFESYEGVTWNERLILALIYMPYLVIPLSYMWKMAVTEKPYVPEIEDVDD
eukprot:m.91952 g.91952  ORF g.91952 m.91952 type:complete len:179 (-) comp8883_c0_seq3:4513-5049(-)